MGGAISPLTIYNDIKTEGESGNHFGKNSSVESQSWGTGSC